MKRTFCLLLVAAALGDVTALAFPPAPYHLIYGMVRDQYGTPLTVPQDQILLETQSGVTLPVNITPGMAAGINYEIKVPMDAGLTSDLYQANALLYATPFQMYVVIGTTTNIPLQTLTNHMALGEPGQSTRVDLTLGVDSNGDGIPDAWEEAFLASLGLNIPLSALNPNLDLAHDGRTLLQEFLLGDYPFDPNQQFQVSIVGMNGTAPIVDFPTMTGRSYILLGSPDNKNWEPLPFNLPTDAPGTTHTFYYAPSIGTAEVQVIPPAGATNGLFIKMLLQ